MKAVLEFNLPEELYEYETHVAANRYRAALSDLYQYFRNARKYDVLPASRVEAELKHLSREDILAVVGMVEQLFIEVLESNDINDHV